VGGSESEPPYVEDVYRTNEVVHRGSAPHHAIDQNTDFRQLVWNEKKHWFTGHRSAYPDYVTTSLNPKYESVIVWPIVPRTAVERTPGARVLQPIRAFLCLDSESQHAFSETRDVAVGWMIADALARAYENSLS
jgi:hypothetical protein